MSPPPYWCGKVCGEISGIFYWMARECCIRDPGCSNKLLSAKVTMTPLPKSILHVPSLWGTTIAVDLSLVGLVLECKAWGVNPLAPPARGELRTVPILSTDDWQLLGIAILLERCSLCLGFTLCDLLFLPSPGPYIYFILPRARCKGPNIIHNMEESVT